MRQEPPGQVIDVGGHRLHIRCEGSGAPAVVLDAALGGSSLSWSLVQPSLARLTRTCAYDRAGFGWSDPGPKPRTVGRLVAELRALLGGAGVAPPYILVGHSFGGLVMRLFAARHPGETAGVVLVDPAHPEDWVRPADKERRQIDRGVRLCQQGAMAARLGLARLVSRLVGAGALGLARGLVKIVSRGGLRPEDEAILAPIWKLPPEARRPLKRFWTEPKFFEALGSQIETICESAAEVLEASAGGYGDLPLVTISSTDPGEYRLRQQERLARLSSSGRHLVASRSGHWIPLDEPRIVIETVAEMIEAVRGSRGS